MNSNEIKALYNEYVMPTYTRFDLCLVKGKGCTVQDPEGNTYLDFGSGIGTNCLGFAGDAWAAAVASQAATLQHTSNLYYTAPGGLLAQQLCQRSGLQKVFFANSGAEANEGAIKAARKYSRDKYGEGRHTILTLQDSFHGRTLATLSATGQEVFHQHFGPFVEGFAHIPPNDIPALESALQAGGVCALMLEAVQGEGGVVPLDAEYITKAAALCEANDVLLILDEVQTGIGRTGSLFAFQQFGVLPDIVTTAKGLGGGLPLAAVLFGEKTVSTLGPGDHATTFGANPVCCAGALAVLENLDDATLAGVKHKGEILKAALLALPGVVAVDGLGLMLGVTFTEGIEARDVVNAAMQKGLLPLTAKHKLRLLPPLIITEEEIQQGVAILQEVLEAMV